jgi:hypothetical protein
VNVRTKAIVAIVVGFFVIGLTIMLIVGLFSGDEVDREENPVIGGLAAGPAAPALP